MFTLHPSEVAVHTPLIHRAHVRARARMNPNEINYPQ